MFQNPSLTFKPYVVDTQKNRLSETIPLSTHNIGFGWVIIKLLWRKDGSLPLSSPLEMIKHVTSRDLNSFPDIDDFVGRGAIA